MELNFNKKKKEYLIVTLNDEEQTRLLVCTPKKKLMEQMMEMNFSEDESITSDSIDDMYSLCTKILNNNLEKKEVSQDVVEDMFDLTDVYEFLQIYMEFTGKQTNSKN